VDQVVVVAPLTHKDLAILRRQVPRRETVVVQVADISAATTPAAVAVVLELRAVLRVLE
jgi:hypothetical protein